MGSITKFLHETIAGNRIVKAFNMEEYEICGDLRKRITGSSRSS
jgi:hypothetical protein